MKASVLLRAGVRAPERVHKARCEFCGRTRPASELICGYFAHYCPATDNTCVDRRERGAA